MSDLPSEIEFSAISAPSPPAIVLPRVTVIISASDGARHAAEALNSIAVQTYQDFDCVIVDDAADGDRAIVYNWLSARMDARFCLIRGQGQSRMASLAAALAASESELVAFFHPDQLWFPRFLQRHVEVHLNGIRAAGVSCSDLVQDHHEEIRSNPVADHQPLQTHGAPVDAARVGDRDVTLPDPDADRDPDEASEAAYELPGFGRHWSVLPGTMYRRTLLELLMPRQSSQSHNVDADGYFLTFSHFIAGSLVIADALGSSRGGAKDRDTRPALVGATSTVRPAEAEHLGVLFETMLLHLLDRQDDLAAAFSQPRTHRTGRWLFRRCLGLGRPIKDPRLTRLLGRGRVFRDRLRVAIHHWRRRGPPNSAPPSHSPAISADRHLAHVSDAQPTRRVRSAPAATDLLRSEVADGALRVCFVSNQVPPAQGGIGRFTSDIARGFAAAGHEVHVMSAQGDVYTVTCEDGVWVHRFPPAPFLIDQMTTEPAFWDLSRIAAVYREVMAVHRAQPFDVVSSPIYQAEGLLLGMDPRLTSILSLHTGTRTSMELDTATREAAASEPRAKLEERCVREHRHTHANSAASLATISRQHGPANGPFVIHHGVQDQTWRFPRGRKDDGRVRILVTGRLEVRKGADILLDVLPAVLARFPEVEFVLVGLVLPLKELQGKSLREALRTRTPAGADWSSRVRFTGVVPDEELYQSYADADIYLFPSRYESFGLAVVEAMSFGLPVIACRAGGVPEIVVDGETGILTDVADRQGLIAAIGGLVRDAETRRRYGSFGRARYLAHFSTTVSVPRAVAAYRAIAAERGPQPSTCLRSLDDALVERFAEVIEEVTPAWRGAAAVDVSCRLIGGAAVPTEAPHAAVIVTCRDGARHIVGALESVAAQTYRDFGCIVVDEASTDGSADIAAQWIATRADQRFRLQRCDRRRGQLESLAAGLASTSGEIVALLDGTDLWFPGFLEAHIRSHMTRPGTFCCSNLVQIDDQDRLLCGTYGDPPFLRSHPNGGSVPIRCQSLSTLLGPHDRSDAATSYAPPYHFLPYPWSGLSGATFHRNLLETALRRDPGDVRLSADTYLFAICHSLAGSIAIDRPLGAYRRHKDEERGHLPLMSSSTTFGADREQDALVVSAVLRCVLDHYGELTDRFAAPSMRRHMRRLFRWCLRSGVPVDLSAIRARLGYWRVFRDRLRIKLLFLRKLRRSQ